MSKYSINDVIPVAAIDNNVLLLNSGSVAVCYEMEVPEIFTLHANSINEIMDILSNSVYANVPEGTVIHFQYDYVWDTLKVDNLKQDTFLQKSTYNHFKNRRYLKQKLYVYFISPNIVSYKSSYGGFVIRYSKKETKIKTDKITEFYKNISKGVDNLSSYDYFNFRSLTEKELLNIINSYLNFNSKVKSDLIVDKNGIQYGDKELHIYSVCDMEQIPDGDVSLATVNGERSTELSNFYRPFTSVFGLELPVEHRVNLIIYYDSQVYWKKEIENNISKLKGSQLMGRQNFNNAVVNEEFLDGIEQENKKIVRFHFSVMFWENNKKEAKKMDRYISGAFDKLGIVPYKPIEDSFFYLLGTFPGNADKMPLSETILTYDNYPFIYFIPEGNYKTDNDGFVFNDRLTQLPIFIDVFDKPYDKKEIDSRNFLIIAPTGGGKSFLSKNILRQFIEMDKTKTVVINIGGDSKIAKTYKEDSIYFLYEEGKTLDVNPFFIEDSILNNDKLEFLIDFISILWKNGQALNNDERSVLSKIFIDYYNINPEIKNSYKTTIAKDKMNVFSFYKFIVNNKKKYGNSSLINIDSLEVNLEKYAVGTYSTLFTKGRPTNVSNKKYIEFELDNIKDHPILFPIFGMLISELTFNTVWKDDGSKKMFFIDEAWKVLEKPGMASLLKYLYKTIRKFDGAVGIAVQQITDIPNNELGNAIIGNSPIKYLLNHSKVIADIPIIKKRLSFSEKTISLLLSVRNNTSGKYPHSEFLLDMGKNSKVLRLEVPKEVYVILESEKNNTKRFYEIYEKNNQDIVTTVQEYINLYLN